eukprot:scaffold32008_cov107-Isochrysis_galbana.AAC.1
MSAATSYELSLCLCDSVCASAVAVRTCHAYSVMCLPRRGLLQPVCRQPVLGDVGGFDCVSEAWRRIPAALEREEVEEPVRRCRIGRSPVDEMECVDDDRALGQRQRDRRHVASVHAVDEWRDRVEAVSAGLDLQRSLVGRCVDEHQLD